MNEQTLRKFLDRAFSLGQTYWQQADSESYSQNKKADATRVAFTEMKHEAVAALGAEVERLRSELAEARTVKESLIVSLDLFGRHSPKGKPCPVCEAIDAAMAGGANGQ